MKIVSKIKGWNCLEIRSDGSSRFVSISTGSSDYLVKVGSSGVGKIVLHESNTSHGRIEIKNAVKVHKKRLMSFRAKSLMKKKLNGNIDSCVPLKEQYLSLFSKSNNTRWNFDLGADIHEAVGYESYGDIWGVFQKTGKFSNISCPISLSPKVSIVIPTYGRTDLVYRLIISILLHDDQSINYEIIVAEDASNEGCCIDQYISGLTVICNQKNLGFLRNCNNAVTSARGQFIVLLNNDTYVTSNWLKELLHPFDENESTGLTGAKLIYPNGDIQEAGGIVWSSGQPWNVAKGKDSYHCEYSYNREVDYLSGAALCIRKTVWDQIGGFDERYSPAYYEDTDLAFQIRKLGLKVIYSALCHIVHDEGLSHGTDIEKGIKQYQSINAVQFRHAWKAEFSGLGEEGVQLNLEKDRGIDLRVLFIDATTPEPNKNAGSYAALQEMKLFQALGAKVTFVPENLAYWSDYTKDLQRLGIEPIYAPYFYKVEEFIKKRVNEFDIIFITRNEVAARYIGQINALAPATPILFNNADLHFLREFRQAESENRVDLNELQASRERELNVIRKADSVLVYTKEEKAALESHFIPSDKIFINPWVLTERKRVLPEKKQGICFLGGFNHSPNVQAIIWFIDHVLPQVVRLDPSIILNIYGSHFPDILADKYKDIDNINIVGFVDSLDDVFDNNRLFIAPLLSGAGIKGKVLDAISYGMPCVLSPVAVEGISLVGGLSCFIASSAEQWSESIVDLYKDEVLLEKFSVNSHQLALNSYGFDKAKEELKNVISCLRRI